MDERHRCPRQLNGFPTTPCQMGKNEVDKNCRDKDVKCPWGVDDPDSNYCLWVWLLKYPFEHTNTEISRLLNISTQRVGQVKDNAIDALRKDPEAIQTLAQFLTGVPATGDEEIVVADVDLGNSFSIVEGDPDAGASDV